MGTNSGIFIPEVASPDLFNTFLTRRGVSIVDMYDSIRRQDDHVECGTGEETGLGLVPDSSDDSDCEFSLGALLQSQLHHPGMEAPETFSHSADDDDFLNDDWAYEAGLGEELELEGSLLDNTEEAASFFSLARVFPPEPVSSVHFQPFDDAVAPRASAWPIATRKRRFDDLVPEQNTRPGTFSIPMRTHVSLAKLLSLIRKFTSVAAIKRGFISLKFFAQKWESVSGTTPMWRNEVPLQRIFLALVFFVNQVNSVLIKNSVSALETKEGAFDVQELRKTRQNLILVPLDDSGGCDVAMRLV
jgi:hypothetical protein